MKVFHTTHQTHKTKLFKLILPSLKKILSIVQGKTFECVRDAVINIMPFVFRPHSWSGCCFMVRRHKTHIPL